MHVERHLLPHLGGLLLSELAGRHITDMITTLAATNNRYGRAPTPSTLHRIRATLRSALNAAVREGLLQDNPARYVEVPSPRRPHALVWTAQRVEAWRLTGERPAVAMWTTEQIATFLTSVAHDRLAVMWWLIALRGLRRGEAAGLRWADIDLDTGVLMVEQQPSMLTDLLAYAAEATARLVLAAAARNPGRRHRRNDRQAKSAGAVEINEPRRPVTKRSKNRMGARRRRPHTSHRRPTKIKAA
jgi:integrase